jgi:hypothetical protein
MTPHERVPAARRRQPVDDVTTPQKEAAVNMTSTERSFAALECRTPDRIPRCDYFIGDFPEAWRRYMGFGTSAEISGDVPPESYEYYHGLCLRHGVYR